MYKAKVLSILQWVCTRVWIIYLVIFIFCITCIDLKVLEKRIKVRHLNGIIPDFSEMIILSKDQNAKNDFNWKPFKDYFELILSYMPDDVLTKNLLGIVDYYTGQEQKAVSLLNSSALVHNQSLFWPNYNLGVIYYKKAMWPQAEEYLFKAVSSNIQLNMVLMGESIVYKQIYASPYYKYSSTEEMNEALSNAYILLLSSLDNTQQFAKMIVISNLGIENQLLPRQDAFYYYAGIGFLNMGQIEKSFLLFQKSIAIEKDNPEAYYYIANIYQKEGRPQEAREFLRISYALHQKHDPRFPYDKDLNLRFF